MIVSGDPEGIADIQRLASGAAVLMLGVPAQGIGGDVGEAALADILTHVVQSHVEAAVRLAGEVEQVGVYAVGVAEGLARADAGVGP